MPIPTGADYHILKAKSALENIERGRVPWLNAMRESVEHLIRALELIQQEREKEKERQP